MTLDLNGPSLDESMVELPAYDRIRTAGRRRRRVRRAGGLVAVVLAIGMVTGGGVVFVNGTAVVPATAVAAEPWTFRQPATLVTQVVTPARDGSYWLAGDGQVAVSHDRGRTWSRGSFPWPTTYAASYDGRIGYALTRHNVSRTSDGGRSWSAPLPAAIDNPGALEVAPSGRLLTFDIRDRGSVAMASGDGRTYEFAFGNDVLKVDGLVRTATDAYAYRLSGAYAGRIVTVFDDRFAMTMVPPNVTIGR
ncbi:sialidase family protein [Fodinicola acaciae]|uniref:sialidase family protein n=1 Tax=Fodinicola acaciae TaxID=2681555 RepID=UPI001FE761E1|nr:sialidase family protein [Fodinicola acaciae]